MPPPAAFLPPVRRLMGPGPSEVHYRVYQALATPILGHLDPEFLKIMDRLQEMLRAIFVTRNTLTLAVPGTGTAGMEASLVNLVEPGDEVLVCQNGAFGGRMAEMVDRLGGKVVKLERPWGEVFSPEVVSSALDSHPAVRVVAMVHAETSTGAHQPLPAIGRLCRERDKLFLVDAVTSLGGAEVRVDDWQIDACYSASQKCLGSPPGLAPLTFGDRALARLKARRSRPSSWYLDLSLIEAYWTEGKRVYHHTAPISMNFALHEALSLVLAEGLEARFRRHQFHSAALVAGLEALGFRMFAREGHRLPMLNAALIPEDLQRLVPEAQLRRRLLDEFGVEIGGGLSSLAGKIWRIGLMGESCRLDNVLHLLASLEILLASVGFRRELGVGVAAASEVYRESSAAAGSPGAGAAR